MYRVLVVEDDPDVQLLLLDLLESFPWDFAVTTTALGEEAIRLALEISPDLVLLDVRLRDEINGYEVARQLRSHPSTAETRIIVLSALDAPVDQHLGKKSGANEYITKPIQSRILLGVLHDMLDSDNSG